MSLPFTQAPAEPALKDVLDQLRKNIFLSLNCHHVGTIQSFNAANQTATVTVNYKKTFYQLNAVTGLYDAVLLDYPIMVDSPVIVLGGGPTALTFPIQAGDECLILFNDRDLDNWFSGGVGAPVGTTRLHSFADAIILVGLRSMGNSLTAYDQARAVLRHGTTLVGVGETLVKIANNSTTLNTLLQNLVTAIEGILVDVAGIGPAQGTVSAASVAALSAVATQIAGLLE